MELNGTIINYYFHCKRQCFLHSNKLNLEDNSEIVKIGKAMHEEKALGKQNVELRIDNICIDRLTNEYVIEVKKSDADIEACKWQLYYYLYVLKSKGIYRKGKLEFVEKNKKVKDEKIIELNNEIENDLLHYIAEINSLILSENVPPKINVSGCKKCAYYEYCYI